MSYLPSFTIFEMDAWTVGIAIAAVALVALILKFINSQMRIKRKLNWMPHVPGWPVLGNALEFTDSGSFLTTLTKFNQKYGKNFFLQIASQNIIVITDYKLLEFVLSSNKVLEKSKNYNFLHTWLGTGLLTSTGAKWKERRKIITPTFHFQILEQFVDVFENQGKILIKKLEKEVGKDSVNIFPYVTLCTLDIICETAMGTSINAQDSKNLEYVASVKEMCRLIVVRGFSAFLMYDFLYKLSWEYPKEKKALKIIHSHTNSVINSRRKELEEEEKNAGTAVEDDSGVKKKFAFLDMLLKSSVNGRKLTDEDIREEVDTFMFEGHDTTTSAISFTLYCLTKHPEIQDKVLEEQKQIVGDDFNKPITHRDLQSMKYLENVIKEGIRMYPPVPFYARHVNEELTFEGHKIPKDVSLFIYAFGVNNDPDNFPNPEKFDPSRFEIIDGKSPYSYIPFSAGPRNCIGQKYAMLEMKSTISRIIRHFELLPSIPEHSVQCAAETVLTSKNGINIRLKKRNSK
ncbi:unnamed protein product [Brassicogethes aeneus]|uniref:Cytochrome P450 n=1 Tax=Brassicogethes aeneus TaxID=1431903 RepID=A0A9P0AUE4_BRAAE|nr:unnamed protein product [Brassicogethes aeneus]